MTDQELVDALDEVWSSIRSLGSELTEEDWKAPTDCPGWTAQDVLAHIVGLEEMSMGAPTPDVEVPDDAHVVGDVGRMNEAWVESMRALGGAEVLERFRRVSEQRLAGLRALDDAGFGADSWTPLGPGTVRDLIPFRIFDSWVHEQDLRRAVGRPGGVEGAGATVTLQRCADMMGYAVGKLAAAPDGTSVVFELTDPMAMRFAIGIEGGRGRRLERIPDTPTVTVTTTGEAFVRLACGRTTPDRVAIDTSGDPDLGARVVHNLRFLTF